MKIMVKVSDISNEARPMAVAEPWLDCLLQEFFNQVFTLSFCITPTGNSCQSCDQYVRQQKELG